MKSKPSDRLLSQHGNVIAADFRPNRASEISIDLSLHTETLYCDGHVTLLRSVASIDGKAIAVTHILGDLATGHIVNL